MSVGVVCVIFFFSSRRRHTRFDCDWSSDVCSSDLQQQAEMAIVLKKFIKEVSNDKLPQQPDHQNNKRPRPQLCQKVEDVCGALPGLPGQRFVDPGCSHTADDSDQRWENTPAKQE